MSEAKKYLWEVLVPATWEEEEIPLKYHHLWDEGVRTISGGLSILKTAKGHWVSPDGNLFIETMIPVRIFCSRTQIDQIADLTAIHYDQEAVMFYRVSNEVKIKHYPKDMLG
jgi:hypothetical protein